MNIIGVTNRKLCSDFYKRIEEISKENLKYLILREKDLREEELEIMAMRVKGLLKNSQTKLIVNGNIKVADNIGAYGIQLSFQKFMEFSKEDFDGIVGVSIHSLSEGVQAEKKGADYLLYGHVFETECKKDLEPRGIEELKEICKRSKIPVYAIGGINQSNFKTVLDAGAYGIAVMSSLMKKIYIG